MAGINKAADGRAGQRAGRATGPLSDAALRRVMSADIDDGKHERDESLELNRGGGARLRDALTRREAGAWSLPRQL